MAQPSTDPVTPLPAARGAVVFLLLDGLRRRPAARSPEVLLCALALDGGGGAFPLAWRQSPTEDEPAWRAFLADLKVQGVGADLVLICSDGHPALSKAVQAAFPDVPVQISLPHRLLALSRKVSPRARKSCLAEARRIFTAPERATAVARFRTWQSGWLRQGEWAVRALEADLAACLAFYRFPAHLWPKIRSVNAVERTFREIRRSAAVQAAESAPVAAPGHPDGVAARSPLDGADGQGPRAAPQGIGAPLLVGTAEADAEPEPSAPEWGTDREALEDRQGEASGDLPALPPGLSSLEPSRRPTPSPSLIILTALAGFLAGLVIAGVL